MKHDLRGLIQQRDFVIFLSPLPASLYLETLEHCNLVVFIVTGKMTRTGEYNVSPPQNRADNKNGSVIQDSNRVETIENEDNNVAEVDNYVGYGFKEVFIIIGKWSL